MACRRFWLWDELAAYWLRPISLGALFILLLCAFPVFQCENIGDALVWRAFGLAHDAPPGTEIVWIFAFFPPLLLTGMYMEQELQRGAYGILRIRSYAKWWLRKLCGMAAGIAVYWLCYIVLTLLICIAAGGKAQIPTPYMVDGNQEVPIALFYLIFPLMYVNSLLFSIGVLALQAVSGEQRIALVLPMGVFAITVIMGRNLPQLSQYLPGVWGMLWRSHPLDPFNLGHFNAWAALCIQAVIILPAIFWIPAQLRRREIANRKQL